MSMPELSRRLENLRAARATNFDAPSGADLFSKQGESLVKLERSLQGVGSAWRSACPPELIDKTSIISLKRGVLTIGADDSATRFELDRHLRTGAERELIRTSPASVRRIKVVLASSPIEGQAS